MATSQVKIHSGSLPLFFRAIIIINREFIPLVLEKRLRWWKSGKFNQKKNILQAIQDLWEEFTIEGNQIDGSFIIRKDKEGIEILAGKKIFEMLRGKEVYSSKPLFPKDL